MAHELAVPQNVAAGKNAAELIRAWASGGGLVCSLNPTAWPKDQAPIAWGILLSDVARHVADALQQAHSLDKRAVLARMREVFDTELEGPTADTKGKFV
jgi:hypothetical protein